jgi:hypothetical protein
VVTAGSRPEWDGLERELHAWGKDGRTATLWWRDDDATDVTKELERLLGVSTDLQIPISIAVIPRRATDSLADRLNGEPGVGVLQHGFDHENHAPPGEKKAEFGAHRPHEPMLAELDRGRQALTRFAKGPGVLSPPWNRIDPALLPRLAEFGFAGVSTFGPRPAAKPCPGLSQVNTHVDPVDWRGDRGFLGTRTVLARMVDHLAARRRGDVDAGEPTGLLTHHWIHDNDTWRFLEGLFERTRRHAAARWLPASEVFGP